MEVLVDIILVQPLKATSREKTAWLGSYRFIIARKLYCFVKPMHSGVLDLAKKPKDANEEARGQKPVDVEVRNLRTRNQRDQV